LALRGKQGIGQQASGTVFRALCIALLTMWAAVAMAQGSAVVSAPVQPKPSAEDVLASMVHHAATIFAGEVYAIRMPQGTSQGAVAGGIPSSRADAVEIEFRVDMGIRGTSVGSNYVLRMPTAAWQQGPPPFALHQRAVTFLKPPDGAGLSGPVQGEGDLPGQPLGILPIDASNQVDLSRLARLVTAAPSPGTAGTDAPTADSNGAAGPAPGAPPNVPGVLTAEGRDTLISGLNQGQMPELNGTSVPFLALVRDLTVLSAAEAPAGGRESTK
jgi:hypothetical protein